AQGNKAVGSMIANMKNPKWAPADDAVVREMYPTGGWRAVQSVLTTRSKAAIQARASRLGVRMPSAKKPPKVEPPGWPVPSEAELTTQLLHLHVKRAYGATPGNLTARIA